MAVQTIRIRIRARNASVAKGPVAPKMRDLVEFSFAEGLAQQFAHFLKADSEATEAAQAELTEVARSYLTWKETPDFVTRDSPRRIASDCPTRLGRRASIVIAKIGSGH